jgi:hypothetical protein
MGLARNVIRPVLDSRACTATHLVVNDRQFQGWLVPFSLVDVDATTGTTALRCTRAELGKIDPADKTVPLQNDGDPDNSNGPFWSRSVTSRLLATPRSSPTTLFPSER